MIKSHAKPLIKYGLVGIVFTTIGPILFLALNTFLPRVLSILISEPILYSLKYLSYKHWVYTGKDVYPVRYIFHVLPLYLVSLFLIGVTQQSLTATQAILLVIIVNGVLGYLWGNKLYST